MENLVGVHSGTFQNGTLQNGTEENGIRNMVQNGM
jgi:hypothetical protein